MTHDPIILKRALDRLAALREEQQQLEVFIATYRRLEACVDRGPASGDVNVEPTPAGVATPARTKPHSTDEIVTTALDVLNNNRAPMKLGALYDAVIARGMVVGGKDPRNNLCAKLSADRRLVTTKEHGWWFAGEALPPWILDETDYPRAEGTGHNAEDPAAFAARPSYPNGAAVDAA